MTSPQNIDYFTTSYRRSVSVLDKAEYVIEVVFEVLRGLVETTPGRFLFFLMAL